MHQPDYCDSSFLVLNNIWLTRGVTIYDKEGEGYGPLQICMMFYFHITYGNPSFSKTSWYSVDIVHKRGKSFWKVCKHSWWIFLKWKASLLEEDEWCSTWQLLTGTQYLSTIDTYWVPVNSNLCVNSDSALPPSPLCNFME